MIYIGIDPGKTGAIAFIYSNGEINIFDYNKSINSETLKTLRKLFLNKEKVKACIEYVHAYPTMDCKTSTTFMKNAGEWLGYLRAFKVPYNEVHPTIWQNKVLPESRKALLIKLPDKRDVKAYKKAKALRYRESKDYMRKFATKAFPQAAHYLQRKKDHNRSDALLIAMYCRLIDSNYDPFSF